MCQSHTYTYVSCPHDELSKRNKRIRWIHPCQMSGKLCDNILTTSDKLSGKCAKCLIADQSFQTEEFKQRKLTRVDTSTAQSRYQAWAKTLPYDGPSEPIVDEDEDWEYIQSNTNAIRDIDEDDDGVLVASSSQTSISPRTRRYLTYVAGEQA